MLEYTGLSLEEVQTGGFRALFPDDVETARHERQKGLERGASFQLELRTRRKDGRCRWFLVHYRPLRDEQGHIVRWYATGTDIEDRKQAEERVRNENLALREEIDRSSMFEEIVESSEALRRVLLIARAIHRRSSRST